jgi:hypothetical protein
MKKTRIDRRAWILEIVLALCLVAWASAQVRAAEITIAAAADLTFVFKDVVSRFEAQTHDTVKVSYGSSGNFFSQIQNGGPFDIFFSADEAKMDGLEKKGLIVKETRRSRQSASGSGRRRRGAACGGIHRRRPSAEDEHRPCHARSLHARIVRAARRVVQAGDGDGRPALVRRIGHHTLEKLQISDFRL